MSSPKVWLITGAATGIGFATTEAALAQGDIVVGTVNRNRSKGIETLASRYPDKLYVLTADVSKQEDVTRLFAFVQKELGRLDVVSNNAATFKIAEVEAHPEESARKIFEVNFWGATHVSKEAVRFFREVNPPGAGGRLLQISSAVGIVALPLNGFYSASKHAFEAISESLAAELQPEWNIKVTLLELGGYPTEGVEALKQLDGRVPPLPAYLDANGVPKVPNLVDTYVAPSSPAKAGQTIWRISRAQDPPLRIPLGKDAVTFVKAWGEALVKNVDEQVSWSDDVAL